MPSAAAAVEAPHTGMSTTSGAATAVQTSGGSGGVAAGPRRVDMADWLELLLTFPPSTLPRREKRGVAVAAGGGGARGTAAAVPLAATATTIPADGDGAAVGRVGAAPHTPRTASLSSSTGSLESTAAAAVTGTTGPSSPSPPLSTEALAAAWRSSPMFAAQMASKPSTPPLALANPWAVAQYGHAYPHSVAFHMWELTLRQFLVMRRNSVFVITRIVGACILSFILGERSGVEGGGE